MLEMKAFIGTLLRMIEGTRSLSISTALSQKKEDAEGGAKKAFCSDDVCCGESGLLPSPTHACSASALARSASPDSWPTHTTVGGVYSASLCICAVLVAR
jgi:hypothetical protein